MKSGTVSVLIVRAESQHADTTKNAKATLKNVVMLCTVMWGLSFKLTDHKFLS